MSDIFFLPLEMFNLHGFITRHADLLYFILLIAFFISIAGITLSRYFDRPYVKPLIVVVGLILGIAAFRHKHILAMIFTSWGSIGYIILIFISAVLPFGLAKGTGLSNDRAAWITYALMYLVAWASFPQLFQILADKGLAIVNLACFVLFFVAVWKAFKFRRKNVVLASASIPNEKDIRSIAASDNRAKNEPSLSLKPNNSNKAFNQAHKLETFEENELLHEAAPETAKQLNTVDDLEKGLAEVSAILNERGSKLSKSDRDFIAKKLAAISQDEQVFLSKLQRIDQILKKLKLIDHAELRQLQKRAKYAKGVQQKILRAELSREKDKHKIYGQLQELDKQIRSTWMDFAMNLNASIEQLSKYGVSKKMLSFLQQAQYHLKKIKSMLHGLVECEKGLVEVLKEERDLIQKEKKAA